MKHYSIQILICTASIISYSQENCINGIDDDNDGFIDLLDTLDCNCRSENLFQNPSFEEHIICPDTNFQANLALNWLPGSDKSYRYYNFCGLNQYVSTFWDPDLIYYVPTPIPSGEGYIGITDGLNLFNDYATTKGYFKQTFNEPLESYTNYEMSFWVALPEVSGSWLPMQEAVINIYGISDDQVLPFTGYDCPENSGISTELLASFPLTEVAVWEQKTFQFNSQDYNIETIMIGSSCTPIAFTASGLNSSHHSNYYYFDDISLKKVEEEVNIVHSGNFCSNDIVFSPSTDPPFNTGFQWYQNGIAISGATENVYEPDYDTNNIYTLLNGDTLNCVISNTIGIEFEQLEVNISTTDLSCPNSNDGSISIEVTEGTPGYLYFLDLNPIPNGIIDSLLPGSYNITVIDSHQCIISETILVLEPEALSYSIEVPDQVYTKDYQLIVSTTDTTSAEINWYIDSSWVSSDYSATLSIPFDQDSMQICAEFVNQNQCYYTKCKNIKIKDNTFIYIPNSFSPNGDGTNDFFKIEYTNIRLEPFRFSIYNRWGSLIWRTRNPDDSWNGYYQNILSEEGNYLYKVEYLNNNGKPQIKTGQFILLKQDFQN